MVEAVIARFVVFSSNRDPLLKPYTVDDLHRDVYFRETRVLGRTVTCT